MHPPSSSQRACTSALPPSPETTAILESIIASLSDGIVVADQAGRLLMSNSAAGELLHARAADAALSEWPAHYGLFHADKSTLFRPEEVPLARAIRGETADAVEIFVRNEAVPDGTWISASARPLKDDAGRPRGGVLILRDITQDKHTEEALRKERDWASAIVDTVGTLVVVLDRRGRVAGFNRACEAVTGYDSSEILGRPLWDVFLVPEEIAEVRRVFDDLKAGDFPNRYENYWLTKDGRRRLIAWSNTALIGRDGRVEHIIGTGMDITDRKRTEDELRQANDTLRAAIETSPLAIVTMDLAGSVKSWNRAAEEIFGWRAEDVVGKPFPIVPDEDEEFFRGNLDRLKRGETISGVERQRRRRDGAVIDVALWNAPQRDGSGNVIGAISVIADITGHKRLEDQLRQSQKMEAVGRLAGGVAHDFNNLLTVITGYTQMILDGLEREHPMRGYVEEIVRASDSAAGLTNQLLAFSRRQIITPQVLDVNMLVSAMDKLLRRLIGEDIDFVTALRPGLPKVKVDAGQFEQVIMNLAVNARDAMPEGGTMTIATGTEVITDSVPEGVAPGAYVVLSVADTGRGMTEETRRQIFEPFFTTKGRGKGTGLGLSTVYGIVKQAGGEVTVESQVSTGTIFRIHLPALERAVAAGVESNPPAEVKRGTETVLLVEDEAGLRKLVSELLQMHGYSVLQAADYREALAVSETYSGAIHLCLTDVVMPGMSGRELAAQITQARPRLKVLLMSGHADDSVLDPAAAGGRFDFLQKPFTPDALLSKVRLVLDT